MKRPLLKRRWIKVLAAAFACGLIAVALVVTFRIVDRQPLAVTAGKNTPSAQAPTTKPTVDMGPSQNNDLFSLKPTWSQNFATTTDRVPDAAYWNAVVGPADNSNQEKQYYTSDYANLRIENGVLRLIATKQSEPQGYSYGSARLETLGKKSFLYGRLDVTAKLPAGVGSWPAIWLYPATDTYTNKSPASDTLRYRNGGEIDFMEAVGFQPDTVYGIAHTASDLTEHADGSGSFNTVKVPNSASTYNTYTLLWTPTTLTFQINGATYYTYTRPANSDYTTWPYDQPFYLIINLAMGGVWGGLETNLYPNGIDDSALPSSLDVKSIYYYPYVGKQ